MPAQIRLSLFLTAGNVFRSGTHKMVRIENPPHQKATDIKANREHAASFEVTFTYGVGHFNMLEDPARFNNLLHLTLAQLTGEC